MNPADARLIESDPDLPALALALDPRRLEAALELVAPGLFGDGSVEVHRLRYKPGTSVQAAVVIRGPHAAPRWMRLAGYRTDEHAKLHKDLRVATARGVGVAAGSQRQRWCLVDVLGDRRLRFEHLARRGSQWRTIAYNPGRRTVARGTGLEGSADPGSQLVAKVYRRGAARSVLARSRVLWAGGGATAEPMAGSGDDVAITRWVAGRRADPVSDAGAVEQSLARTRLAGDRIDHVAVEPVALARRCRAALGSVAALLPDAAGLVADLTAWLTEALEGSSPECDDRRGWGFVHGDLSPDQVVISERDGEALLVDLDDCGRGPHGWDAASWVAAQVATGSPRPRMLTEEHLAPVMLAAALAIRSPEPFQRRREHWEVTTLRMLEEASAAMCGAQIRTGGP